MKTHSIKADLELKHDAILGEGPVWDETEGKLYWVDILSGHLMVYNPKQKDNVTFDIGEHLGAAALRAEGGLVIALQSGFAFCDPGEQSMNPVADPESHLSGNRFNDGKCDPSGRFWAGTMAYDLSTGAGSLYCLNPDLSVDVKLQEVTISNGMAWNSRRNTFFYIDTPARQIYSFDYEDRSGKISNRMTVRKFDSSEGFPDGMTIDDEECLWVALYGGGKVIRVDPTDGSTLFEIRLPVPKPTSCTFGGAQLDELYITTAREHMSKQEIAHAPLSGSLFRAKLPVKGMPPTRFEG